MIERLGVLIVIVGVAWLIDRGRAAFRSHSPAVNPEQRPARPAEKPPAETAAKETSLRSDWLRLQRRAR